MKTWLCGAMYNSDLQLRMMVRLRRAKDGHRDLHIFDALESYVKADDGA